MPNTDPLLTPPREKAIVSLRPASEEGGLKETWLKRSVFCWSACSTKTCMVRNLDPAVQVVVQHPGTTVGRCLCCTPNCGGELSKRHMQIPLGKE